MSTYTESECGYMVYEDSGTSPSSYGASEEWFQFYDEAIEHAINIVRKRAEELKHYRDCNSVLVYEGAKSLLHESHSIPSGKVVFNWSNWKRSY